MTKGITIMQKLEDIRITKAKQYLESGSYQNQEISELVGFQIRSISVNVLNSAVVSRQANTGRRT